jgi:rhodanese-related sulfurtransferase
LRLYEEHCSPADAAAHSGPEMTVKELKARVDEGNAPVIVDVREPAEFDICRIPGARLIPLGQLPARIAELDPSTEIVVHCKAGGRSAKATALLRERGFTLARNLSGGILAWIDQVDPTQAKY